MKRVSMKLIRTLTRTQESLLASEPMKRAAEVKKDIFPKGVVAEDGTIAFRISKHPIVSEIIKN